MSISNPIVLDTAPERKEEHYTPGCTCQYGDCFNERATELHSAYQPVPTDLNPAEQRKAMQHAVTYYWRLIARHEAAIGQPPEPPLDMSQADSDAMQRRIIAGYRLVLDTLEPALAALENEGR